MSRLFSSSARILLKWLGFDKNQLDPTWKGAIEKFSEPGGSAEAKLGSLTEIYIKSRNGNPVHRSHFNPADQELVISARIKGENDTKTCHIYADGTGTTKKGDEQC